MTKGRAIGAAALAVGIVLVVLVGSAPPATSPLAPTSVGSDGTRAFVELMEAFGSPVAVENGTAPPAAPPGGPPGYALVLSDSDSAALGRLGGSQRSSLVAWTRSGGHLVVADPHSPLATLADPGSGSVVPLDGPGIFTNGRLGTGDDATVAARLAGAGTGQQVYLVLPPPAGSGTVTLASMLDLRTRVVLGGLALALAMWVAARARRHGRLVAEESLVSVDGSVLTESVGRLLMRSSNTQMAATLTGGSGAVARDDGELLDLPRRT